MQSLQAELMLTLRRAERNRRIIRWTKTPIFLAVVLWLIFVLFLNFSGPYFLTGDQYGVVSSGIMIWMLPAMALLIVLELVFVRAYSAFSRQEQAAVSHIVTTLFPGAEFQTPARNVPDHILRGSLFMSNYAKSGNLYACTFASLSLPACGSKLTVTDLGLGRNLSQGNAGLAGMYRTIVRPLFASCVEKSLYDFRGMFAWAEMEQRVPGSIVILPDHLENKLGYLARSIQRLKESDGRKLVQLEDPEFERLFAVYASDEVLCRRVLTPVMMRDITRLQQKYGRDMMLSFNANRFYIAVSMPDGFLSLRSEAAGNGRIVEEIQADIAATESVLRELRIE